MTNTQTTPAGQVICRSCGFDAHKPEDLIDGQCPRWAPGDQHSTHMGYRTIRDAAGLVAAMPFARCACGWDGPSRIKRSAAVEDGFAHLTAVAS